MIKLIAVIHLFIGVAETFILWQNVGAKEVCNENMWRVLFALCIAHYIISSIASILIYSNRTIQTWILYIMDVVLSFWIVYEFYVMSDECASIFNSSYHVFWITINIENILCQCCMSLIAIFIIIRSVCYWRGCEAEQENEYNIL